jgi:hypothetical protein
MKTLSSIKNLFAKDKIVKCWVLIPNDKTMPEVQFFENDESLARICSSLYAKGAKVVEGKVSLKKLLAAHKELGISHSYGNY